MAEIDPFAFERCPGCGCEPEVTEFYLRADVRVGYDCTCGVMVIDGLVVGGSANV